MPTAEPRADRNKRIALEAIAMLERAINGESIGLLDVEFESFRERWAARGVNWVHPPCRGRFDMGDWVTAEEMAERADVKPGTVRMWHHRGYITSERRRGQRVYSVGDVVKYLNRRQQNA